ncbi:hypothetical protein [Nonomuraea dietziae]|uniref:hypothetical protein n=1 Tax=Nonomuraea dietziae TaxID=65515 RepID=UPI0031CEC8A5
MRVNCPDCGLSLAGPAGVCPRCGLPLTGPVAVELWQVDGALAGLRVQEAELRGRRERLLSLLRADRARLAGRAASQEAPETGGATPRTGAGEPALGPGDAAGRRAPEWPAAPGSAA